MRVQRPDGLVARGGRAIAVLIEIKESFATRLAPSEAWCRAGMRAMVGGGHLCRSSSSPERRPASRAGSRMGTIGT